MISETTESRKDPLVIFTIYLVVCIAFLAGSLVSINDMERGLKSNASTSGKQCSEKD